MSKISKESLLFKGYSIPNSADFVGNATQVRTLCFYYQDMRQHQGVTVTMLCGNIIYTDKDWEYPLHRHSHHEIIFPQEGTYRCSVNGQELSVRPGAALLVQAGELHQDHLSSGIKYFGFEFGVRQRDTGLPVRNLFVRGSAPQEHVVPLRRREDIEALLGAFQSELQRQPGGMFPVVNGIFQALFWLVLGQADKRVVSEDPGGLNALEELQKQRILECFQQHHMEHMENGRLCQLLGMSASTLGRLCRRFFGMPPMHAYMQMKMEYVKSHLADHPKCLLKDLAQSMGFADQFHFSKWFRQIVGVNPKRYLDQVLRQKEKGGSLEF